MPTFYVIALDGLSDSIACDSGHFKLLPLPLLSLSILLALVQCYY
jgi:hypothetical protein